MCAVTRMCWVALTCSAAGCVGGGFFGDGSSISVGTVTTGLLRRGALLAASGEGYEVPRLWAARQASYGTDELVTAIRRAAARVGREYPGGVLGVADLSHRGGLDSELHRSHRSGRDADLLYYAVDDEDRPVRPPSSMPRYLAATGESLPPHPPLHGVVYGPVSPRWFDVPRNWALVRALLEDPAIEVQYMFVNQGLKELLLEHARNLGEPADLVDRAAEILHQPGDSLPHDDHMHLRVYCSPTDRAMGCVDRGPLRWWKKRLKYMPPLFDRATVADALDVVRLWLPVLLPSRVASPPLML